VEALARAGRWVGRVAAAAVAGEWRAAAHVLSEPLADAHLLTWRNLVVAPLSEEFVFRGCMAPLLLMKGFSRRTTILITPLFFGAAHLHHLYELVMFQHAPLHTAVIAVSVQFVYTSVFGAYETYLLLQTHSLAAPMLVHAFCNWMGVPNPSEMTHQARGSPALAGLLTAAGVVSAVVLFDPLMHSSHFPQT